MQARGSPVTAGEPPGEPLVPRGPLRDDLLLRRGLDERRQCLDGVAGEREVNLALEDLADALRGDVARFAQVPFDDGQAVEDVRCSVARDLVDPSDLVAGDVDDAPAGLDDRPGDRVGHGGQTALPSMYQT